MKLIKHLRTVFVHKKEVFKLCRIAGITYQGIIHDLSKFSPTELIESVKYYQGDRSPIMACKEDKGYSEAWFHHRGRNKHHAEYWVDKLYSGGVPFPMPYKYELEMVCDIIAASKAYNGDKFNNNLPYEHWSKKLRKTTLVHKKTLLFVSVLLKNFSSYGESALLPKNTKALYRKIEKKYKFVKN